tara:strand:- start:1912 stop:2346 length:435 start_codon:yes stop_codon:yes gene_type:complete
MFLAASFFAASDSDASSSAAAFEKDEDNVSAIAPVAAFNTAGFTGAAFTPVPPTGLDKSSKASARNEDAALVAVVLNGSPPTIAPTVAIAALVTPSSGLGQPKKKKEKKKLAKKINQLAVAVISFQWFFTYRQMCLHKECPLHQ